LEAERRIIMKEFDLAQSTQHVKDNLCPLVIMVIFLIAASLIIHLRERKEVLIRPGALQTADALELIDHFDNYRSEFIRIVSNRKEVRP